MTKKILLGLAPIVVAAPIATVVSCSSSSIGTNKQFFDVKVKTSKTKNNNLPSEVNIYQANQNQNAISKLESIQRDLTVGQLQFDFKTALQDFYEAYEFESNEYEMEIDRIDVVSKNADGSFKLKVTYELEIDTRDKEIKKTQEITWTPTMKLISKEGIEKIKQEIIQLTSKNNSGIDLSDIKELFLGEKDDDDFDDRGIFDRIALINKDYDGLASLLAYEISIDDIFGQLEKPGQTKAPVTTKTKFLVPSLSLNSGATVFVPNQKPDMDYAQKSLNKSDLDTIFGTDATPKFVTSTDESQTPFVTELNKLFTKQYVVNDLVGAKAISRMILLNPNANQTASTTKEYQVIIEFKNSRKAPDMIVFLEQATQ